MQTIKDHPHGIDCVKDTAHVASKNKEEQRRDSHIGDVVEGRLKDFASNTRKRNRGSKWYSKVGKNMFKKR